MKLSRGTGNQLISDEGGNVESALVIIPLLILFLSILQIALGVFGRAGLGGALQGEVSRYALFGSHGVSGGTNSLGAGENQSIPLSGGGSILISKRTAILPIISPLLINRDKFENTGIAVDENP